MMCRMCSLINCECNESEKNDLNAILSKLLAGMILVIDKQLNKYIQGPFQIFHQQKLCRHLQLAPVHNIFAEQTLGLADHYLRRARNCTIGHIDGKVKCKKNDTLTWLVAKPSDEQEKIILFSISEAKTMRAQLKKREENIAKIQGQLVIEK